MLVTSITMYSGHAFTSQVKLANSKQTSSAIFGKRARAMKKVKKIFKGDDEVADVAETQTNFPNEGQKVKLSNSRAKDLAKKYQDIDDLEERAFQVLTDLKMVGRS